MKIHTILKLSSVFLLAPVLCFSVFANAQTIVNKDGREVVLNEDGTWEYVPEGIIVETEDGRKARLKSDNTWQFLGDTNLQEEVISGNSTTSLNNKTKAILKETFITKSGPKATNIIKNSRTSSELNFMVEVTLDQNAQPGIQVGNLKPSFFKVSDSKNKKYEIASITSDLKTLSPGKPATLKITTTSAPGNLFGPKEVYLKISQDIPGLSKPAEFSISTDNIETR